MSEKPPHPAVARYERYVNPAFVRLLGTFGYGRVFVRAKGSRLWDDAGREYIDLLAGFGAVNLGHNPPELLEKLRAHLDGDAVNLLHVGPQPHAADLAERLAKVLPEPLEVTLLSNSGGEAVEAAIKLARAATRRSAIVYARGGFHGTGLGPLSVMGHARLRRDFEPLVPDCHEVPFGDALALEQELRASKVAGVLLEPVQAEAGVVLPPAGYLEQVAALCRRHGALLMLDEVQTGLGRTGKLFAFERHAVVPDVLILGKSLGGSLVPISATVTSRELQQRAYGTAQKFDLHGTTYSGNALCSAVALATLELTLGQELPDRAAALGERFTSRLRRRISGHPLVRDVRGQGLLIGVELGPTDRGLLQKLFPGLVAAISEKVFGQWLAVRLLEQGFICQPASQQWNVLRIEPPLTISEAELDAAEDAIASTLAEYSELRPLISDVAQRLGEQYREGWAFR